MANRYKLTDEVREKWTPIIKEFIEKLESYLDTGAEWSPECVQVEWESRTKLELSDTELNPYTLGEILKELGYEETEIDDNGWQMDFWIHFEKEGYKELVIRGCGITFEMALVYYGAE